MVTECLLKDGKVIEDFWCMDKTKRDLQNEVGKLVSQSFMCYTKIPNSYL